VDGDLEEQIILAVRIAEVAILLLGVHQSEEELERVTDVDLARKPQDRAALERVVAGRRRRARDVAFRRSRESQRAERAVEHAIAITNIAMKLVGTGRAAPPDRAAFEFAALADNLAAVEHVGLVALRETPACWPAACLVLGENASVDLE